MDEIELDLWNVMNHLYEQIILTEERSSVIDNSVNNESLLQTDRDRRKLIADGINDCIQSLQPSTSTIVESTSDGRDLTAGPVNSDSDDMEPIPAKKRKH